MKYFVLCTIFMIFINGLWASVQIKNVDFIENGQGANESKVSIVLSEKIKTAPILTVNSYMIQLELSDVMVWPKIDKKISWKTKNFDTNIMAYQYDKNLVRFRIVFPEKIEFVRDLVHIEVLESSIDIFFPKYSDTLIVGSNSNSSKEINNAQSKNNALNKNNVKEVDEKYLNDLLNVSDAKNDDANSSNKVVSEVGAKVSSNDEVSQEIIEKKSNKKEKVNIVADATKNIGNDKKNINGFSRNLDGANDFYKKDLKTGSTIPWGYLGKYFFFMVIVLGLFYGIVYILKKGVLGKGKLGFLNNSSVVTVLSNNYIAPKRSLMTVKVHDQIFLLSNSENGMTFLAEIKSPTSVIKEREKNIAGNNFDSDIEHSNKIDSLKLESQIKIKDNIMISAEAQNKDLGRFNLAEQIKKKVKSLRPLQ